MASTSRSPGCSTSCWRIFSIRWRQGAGVRAIRARWWRRSGDLQESRQRDHGLRGPQGGGGMKLESLKITGLTVRAVVVPMRRTLATSTGGVTVAPLVLIDLKTNGGVVGRSYLFAIGRAHLAPLVKLVEVMGEMVQG